MYDLTKAYKSKAQAVNAIRMTARNKGWTVLDTEAAETHVWPTAEGFVVNNTTLNVALGFASKTEVAVADAINEQAKKDAKAPKLQAPSKLEQDKKAAKQKPAKKEPATDEPAKPTRCETQNGARRPLRGKTLLVWETTEMLAAGPNGCPTLKEVYEELCRLEPGFNKTTAGIQFYACRAYNGWEKK